jgi:hypothetical protein
MPKIPTFTSEARPTANVGSAKSNLQIPLSQTVANAVSPITDFVVKKAVQANDTQNRTEALRLGNEFTRELQTVEDYIANDSVLGVNKEAANAYYKEQTNSLINKYKLESTNNASQTLFENNALSAVNRGMFRIDNTVEKNVFLDLQNQVDEQEKSLLTQALFNNRDENIVDEFGMAGKVNAFDYATLQTNLTKLYTDAFTGKIPAPQLNEMIANIPALVQGFQANKDIYDKPSFAYEELKKGENSLAYPDLNFDQRTKLIKKVETLMVQPLKKEFNNVIFSLQDKGTEQPFDFNFAKKILKANDYNELITNYDLAKANAKDVQEINKLPLSEIKSYIDNKNYNTDAYTGGADRVTQSKLKQGLIKAQENRIKKMNTDPVKFLIETNNNIAELTNDYIEEDNPDIKKANRLILTNALIDEQIRMEVSQNNIKILTKQEATQIKKVLLDSTQSIEKKISFIDSLPLVYGVENMNKIQLQLQQEKLPVPYLTIMSTNSTALKEDILKGTSTDNLEKLVLPRLKSGETRTTLLGYVATAMKDSGYESVIYSQPDGSVNQDDFILALQDTLYQATLSRINRDKVGAKEAAKSVVSDFTADYQIDSSLTYMIPIDINGEFVNQGFVKAINDNILLAIQDVSEGNYIDRFHGADGYMHYATFANVEGLTEEMVKEKITSTIRNTAQWLMSADGTGAVLYAEFANGTIPIVNAKGQKIETSFLNPSSTYPVTGDNLPLIEYVDPYGEIDLEDNTSVMPVGSAPKSISSVINDAIFSSANASEFVEFENVDIVEIANYEGNKIQGYVPDAKGSKSGVTIASGLDLGNKNINDLKGLPENILTKLKPFLGLKGNEAVAKAKELNITNEEAKIINTFAHKQSLTKLKKKWEKDSKQSFNLLSKEQATVLASVAFQYGDLKTQTPTFYKLALAGDWQGVYEELMNFNDNYPTRRKKEAAYLKKYLDNN